VVDLIRSSEAAKLLDVCRQTLIKYETKDGQWCVLLGYSYRFRVYNYGGGIRATRRYDRNEILRVLRKYRAAN